MTVANLEGVILIESFPEETNEEWRSGVERLLRQIHRKPNWWRPFTAGLSLRRGDRIYRELDCLAGSVALALLIKARQGKGVSRAVIFRDECQGAHRAFEIRSENQTEFDPQELRKPSAGTAVAVLENPSPRTGSNGRVEIAVSMLAGGSGLLRSLASRSLSG